MRRRKQKSLHSKAALSRGLCVAAIRQSQVATTGRHMRLYGRLRVVLLLERRRAAMYIWAMHGRFRVLAESRSGDSFSSPISICTVRASITCDRSPPLTSRDASNFRRMPNLLRRLYIGRLSLSRILRPCQERISPLGSRSSARFEKHRYNRASCESARVWKKGEENVPFTRVN